jgi:hypothetical protein
MTTLLIKDLSLAEELSDEQLEKTHGGMASEYEHEQEVMSGPFALFYALGVNPNYPYPSDARTDAAR